MCTVKLPVCCTAVVSDFPQDSHEIQPVLAVWQEGQTLSGQATGTQGGHKQRWVTTHAKGQWGEQWEDS